MLLEGHLEIQNSIPILRLDQELEVEVLENRYSRKWSTYYVTVIDTANRAWYFAYRSGLKKGERITIRGTVKRPADGMVQLNRVKLINGGNSD